MEIFIDVVKLLVVFVSVILKTQEVHPRDKFPYKCSTQKEKKKKRFPDKCKK